MSDTIRATLGGTAFDGAGAAAGDLIDLTGVAANESLALDQAFVTGGAGKGQVQLVDFEGTTLVLGNTNYDADLASRRVGHMRTEWRLAERVVCQRQERALWIGNRSHALRQMRRYLHVSLCFGRCGGGWP